MPLSLIHSDYSSCALELREGTLCLRSGNIPMFEAEASSGIAGNQLLLCLFQATGNLAFLIENGV